MGQKHLTVPGKLRADVHLIEIKKLTKYYGIYPRIVKRANISFVQKILNGFSKVKFFKTFSWKFRF